MPVSWCIDERPGNRSPWMNVYIQAIASIIRAWYPYTARSGTVSAGTRARVTNHTAASEKNTAGPVAGSCAPHGQTITAMAIAITKCNPHPTTSVHIRCRLAIANPQAAALSADRPVMIQRSTMSWIMRNEGLDARSPFQPVPLVTNELRVDGFPVAGDVDRIGSTDREQPIKGCRPGRHIRISVDCGVSGLLHKVTR